jgi:hypothetical protein
MARQERIINSEAGPRQFSVIATTMASEGWQMALYFGISNEAGQFVKTMSPGQARELAVALVRCANHYDAETARIAAEVSA